MMYVLLMLSIVGLLLNLAFADTWLQPDWVLALWLGALLAHRGYWPWVFVGVGLHDMVFYWSPWACLPWVVLMPIALIWSDAQAGASLVQRLVMMLLMMLPLWFWHWPVSALILTALLTLIVWYQVSQYHVEPA